MTTKILVVGDMHLRGTTPRNRTDDYKEASKLKLKEIFQIAKHHSVNAIICPGDIWDRPEVSIKVLLEFVEVFGQSPCEIWTTPGNHDIHGYNIESYGRTSLRLLELLVPNFHVVTDPLKYKVLGENVAVSFQPYASEVDIDGYGYAWPDTGETFLSHMHTVKVTHGYLMQQAPVWDKYTLIEDCITDVDLVINGHDHRGHRVFKRHDGKLFCNPGALMRKEATVHNQNRKVEVALLTFGHKEITHEMIELTTAKPGDEVLDRSHIEAENDRRAAMDNFKMLVQAKTGETAIIDIDAVVEQIAKAEAMDPEVVKIALDKIHEEV